MDRRQWIRSINALVAMNLLPNLAAAHPEAEHTLELRRCIVNAIATQPCHIGVDFEDFQNLIMAQTGHCAFGFGYATGGEAAANLAIAYPLLGLGRLKQAAAVMIGVETPLIALKTRISWGIVKHVKQHLHQDPYILFSHNNNRSGDGDNFRVSILATGIPV